MLGCGNRRARSAAAMGDDGEGASNGAGDFPEYAIWGPAPSAHARAPHLKGRLFADFMRDRYVQGEETKDISNILLCLTRPM